MNWSRRNGRLERVVPPTWVRIRGRLVRPEDADDGPPEADDGPPVDDVEVVEIIDLVSDDSDDELPDDGNQLPQQRAQHYDSVYDYTTDEGDLPVAQNDDDDDVYNMSTDDEQFRQP